MYFLVVSSLRTCATWEEKIFERPARSWMPTIVTPIGHAAFPIASSMYASCASLYLRESQQSAMCASFSSTSTSSSFAFNFFVKGLMSLRVCRCKDVRSRPSAVFFSSSLLGEETKVKEQAEEKEKNKQASQQAETTHAQGHELCDLFYCRQISTRKEARGKEKMKEGKKEG
eukprot:GHVT01006141.1.p1 GENE.GHVT01006141.1~~GHVT01006141.1.p1  ORF type:complete len:172 (+),score=33.98 GHVT01006141.1:706-1221(+)